MAKVKDLKAKSKLQPNSPLPNLPVTAEVAQVRSDYRSEQITGWVSEDNK